MEMLYIFDKDGTLVGVPSPAENRPANRPEEQSLLPGRLEKIQRLRELGARIAIASNQGGVAWGFISYEQAAALMEDCARKIGGADAIRFCPHDARAAGSPNARMYAVQCNCRKPAPGMLLSILREMKADPADAIYIGDRPEDEAAAQAAGVRFAWADDFFGGNNGK